MCIKVRKSRTLLAYAIGGILEHQIRISDILSWDRKSYLTNAILQSLTCCFIWDKEQNTVTFLYLGLLKVPILTYQAWLEVASLVGFHIYLHSLCM